MALDAAPLHGVIPPVCTPLTPERAFDPDSFRRLLNHQIDAGIHGAFILGSTSEAPLLTNDVQDEVIATAVEHIDGRVPVIAGCIDFTTNRVIERAQHARELGADAVVVCPPFYVTPSVGEMIRHFDAVRSAVDLPILAYDVPAATHVKLPRPVIHELASSGAIVGIKDSSGQDANFRGVILDNQDNQDFRIFTGSELVSDTSIFMGAHGIVPGLANVDPAGYVRLFDAASAGEWAVARKEQDRLYRLFDIIYVPEPDAYGFSAAAHGAFKVALYELGLIAHPHTAMPHTLLTDDHHQEIRRLLQRAGLVPQ